MHLNEESCNFHSQIIIMDCPVCHHKGVPEASRVCPNCHSDLTTFRKIHQLYNDIRQKRNIIFVLAFSIVVLIVILGYIYLFSDGMSSRYSRMQIQAKNSEIIDLKKQNTELRQTIYDMQNGIMPLDTMQHTDQGFKKVIPSAKDEKNTPRAKLPVQKRTSQAAQSSSGKVTYYSVKAGETLYSIALKEYGDGKKYKKIMSDNNITDASDVKVGMRLKIIK